MSRKAERYELVNGLETVRTEGDKMREEAIRIYNEDMAKLKVDSKARRLKRRETDRLVEESKKRDAENVAKWVAKAAVDEKKLMEAHERMNYPRPSKVLAKIAKEKGDEDDQEALELILTSFGRDLILTDLFKNVIIPMQKEIAELKEALLKSE